MDRERVAQMNPDAVSEAKVFTGKVRFFDGEHVEMNDVPFVEVGKWAAAGEEQSPEDYDCSYYAALILGYELNMDWLPAGYDEVKDRKFLIFKDRDENDRPIPFTIEEANIVAQNINTILGESRQLKQTQTE